jgi:hypothetical protein
MDSGQMPHRCNPLLMGSREVVGSAIGMVGLTGLRTGIYGDLGKLVGRLQIALLGLGDTRLAEVEQRDLDCCREAIRDGLGLADGTGRVLLRALVSVLGRQVEGTDEARRLRETQ